MSKITDLLPTQPLNADASPRFLDAGDEEADEVLDALAADTRRDAFWHLFERPTTASELAERLDTSLQNVDYHLSILAQAGLIEPIGSRYSDQGNEMTVYGPASDPLVFVGDRSLQPRIRRSLTDVVAGLGLLGAASVLVQWGVERLVDRSVYADTVTPAGRPLDAESVRETLAWLAFGIAEPGVLFFVGSLLIAGLVTLATRR